MFCLLAFSIFIAKPAINICYGLLMLLFILKMVQTPDKKEGFKKFYVIILILPVIFGFILSFFSLSGIQGAFDFLVNYRFLFLVLPFTLFIKKSKDLSIILYAMNIGVLFDLIYVVLNSDWSNPFGNIYGVHKFGRHSDMLFTLCLINSGFLLAKFRLRTFAENLRLNIGLTMNTALIFIFVILIGQRGAYIGLYIGLSVLSFLYSKRLLILLFLLTLVASFGAPDYVLNRTRSIIDPALESNSDRLQLLTLCKDFMVKKKIFLRGTGAKGMDKTIENFLAEQPPKYYQTYARVFKLYPGNFHNSYLQMAVEVGPLFVVFYLSSIAWMLYEIYKRYRVYGPDANGFIPAVLATAAGFLISQIFHEEFYRYGGLVFFIFFYGACMITEIPPGKISLDMKQFLNRKNIL